MSLVSYGMISIGQTYFIQYNSAPPNENLIVGQQCVFALKRSGHVLGYKTFRLCGGDAEERGSSDVTKKDVVNSGQN